MKYSIYFLALFFFSCGNQEDEINIPDSIVEKGDLISMIVELEILEAHYQRQFSRVDLYRNSLDSSSQLIFEDHGVTKQAYEESISYYSNIPDSLFVIYEAALDSINFRLSAASN